MLIVLTVASAFSGLSIRLQNVRNTNQISSLSGGFDICKQVFHIKGKSNVQEAQVQILSIGTCREKESLDCSI
jgi:hypothetical protein